MDEIYETAMARTGFAEDRRTVLRGTTLETVGAIPDRSLDCVYVDGDHTLRGITLDLLSAWPKVRPGGLLGGDDFVPSIWQHSEDYEPSLVCPFAAHFAEAVGAPLIIFPFNQFVIIKPTESHGPSTLTDLTGLYTSLELRPQVRPRGPTT
jgi:hypothetical protein